MQSTLSSRFEEALTFAAQLHATQCRKGTAIPYLAHLLAVASLVLTHDGNEDEAIAALLHDAIEDQGGSQTRTIIHQRFGERVTAIVDGCTDTDVFPKPPWRARKEEYLRHLQSASLSVQLVAAADKLDNARTIVADHRSHGPEIWTRFNAGHHDQLWFYRSCVTALRDAGPESIVRELDIAVQEMERL
jgi:(p)ppGpp synthase/HD superfamily hydrolase